MKQSITTLESAMNYYNRVDIFSCFIEEVVGGIAKIAATNMQDIIYYMDVPRDDLEKHGIECNSGVVFRIELLKKGEDDENEDDEKIVFHAIPRRIMTEEEINESREYYKEKYGDL